MKDAETVHEHTDLHDLDDWVFDPAGWAKIRDREWQSPTYAGHPKLTATRGYYTRWSFRNLTLRLEMRQCFSGAAIGGVIFRAQDSSTFYLAEVQPSAAFPEGDGNGHYIILSRCDGDGYVRELEEAFVGIPVAGKLGVVDGRWDYPQYGRWNTLQVDADGPELTVAWNGRNVVRTEDSHFTAGLIGLYAIGEVQIRDLTVGSPGQIAGVLRSRPWPALWAEVGVDKNPRFDPGQPTVSEGIARLPNGTLVLSWMSHPGTEPRARRFFAHSADSGHTWTAMETAGRVSMPGLLSATRRGQLLIHGRAGSGASRGAAGEGSEGSGASPDLGDHFVLYESGDGGRRWSKGTILSTGDGTPIDQLNAPDASYYAYAPIRELRDGTLLLCLYSAARGEETGPEDVYRDQSHLFRSTDGGKTWEGPIVIGPGVSDMNETDVAQTTDGALVAVIRPCSSSDAWTSRSEDGGLTWSRARRLPFIAVSPTLTRTRSGTLVLWCRVGPAAVRISRDSGETWSKAVRIADMTSEGWGEVAMVEGEPDEVLILQGRADRSHLPWRLKIHRFAIKDVFGA